MAWWVTKFDRLVINFQLQAYAVTESPEGIWQLSNNNDWKELKTGEPDLSSETMLRLSPNTKEGWHYLTIEDTASGTTWQIADGLM